MTTPPTEIQIVYASAATVGFSPLQLGQLLATARANNQRLGVTGMLLFHEESFLQVLEGAEATLSTLLDTIRRDARHDRILMLQKGPIASRSFGDWTMGLVAADANLVSRASGLNDYLQGGLLSLAGDGKRLERLLQGFRDGGWRQHIC